MSREIDRSVAERLGYHVRQIEISAQTGRPRWCLVDPNGGLIHPNEPYLENEDQVWEALAPPFSTDIALAIQLVPVWTEVRSVMLRQTRDGWLASINDLGRSPEGAVCEEMGRTLAEAICKVWLMWQQAT